MNLILRFSEKKIEELFESALSELCENHVFQVSRSAGFGILNYKVSEEKGYVCGIKVIDETDDIILVSSDGIIIRIRACDVRIMGRYATGVRLMRVGEDVSVVTFNRVEHDDNAEIAAIEEPAEEEIQAELEAAASEEKNEVVIPEAAEDLEEEDSEEDGGGENED